MPDRIHVLKVFEPFLCLLNAYNLENFRYAKNWHSLLPHIRNAACTTFVILFIPVYSVLSFWNLLDNGTELKNVVVALPLLFTGLQLESTYIAMIMKNHTITDIISRLQKAIERRG